MRRPTALLVALLFLFVTTPAVANDTLKGALGNLDWGASPDDVLDIIKDKMEAEYKEKSKDIYDTAKKDRMRKRLKERQEEVAKSLVELKDGVKSGLEVSIVANEFVKNNSESVLVVREDFAIRYYFFLEGRLYKLVIAYDSSYIDGLAYDSFVYAVGKKYGKATKEVMDEDGILEASIWEKSDTRLRVKDTYDIYSTHLMVFSNKSDDDKVFALHEEKANKRTAGPEIDDDIDDLTMGDDEALGNDSAADDILGGNTDVDLTAGLPQEDLDALKQQQLEAEGGAQKTAEEKKKKKKKRKKRRKKKFKEKELKDRQKKLIIY